jgi:hypothetical protein
MFKTLPRVMSKSPKYTIFKYKTLIGLFFAIFLDNLFFSDSRARPVLAFRGALRLCETK